MSIIVAKKKPVERMNIGWNTIQNKNSYANEVQ